MAFSVTVLRALAISGTLGWFAGNSALVFADPPPPGEGPNESKNLARMNCGAHITEAGPNPRLQSSVVTGDDNKNLGALLLDDDTVSCPLPQGETGFVISLAKIANLDRFAFINENAAAEGDVSVAVSNYHLAGSSQGWIAVDTGTTFTGKRVVNLSMHGVEAKYVRLSFHVVKEGRFAGVALYGQPTLEHFATHSNVQNGYTLASARLTKRAEDTLNFNFANLYAHARVVYVSSGKLSTANRMIDDDADTFHRFAASDEHPTVVIELNDEQRLHRLSVIYQSQAGQLDVYLLNELGKLPEDLDKAKPIDSLVDVWGRGKAAVNFDPRNARYVVFRWRRHDPGSEPFEIAEIGAFGVVPLSWIGSVEGPSLANGSMAGEGISSDLGSPPAVSSVSP